MAPRRSMGTALRLLSDIMPMSYAVDAMTRLSDQPGVSAATVLDLALVAGCALLALALGAATLRRRTA